MRTKVNSYSLSKSLLVLISIFWHASFASAADYSDLKVKVWLSASELQIQFIEPETNSTALLHFTYQDRKKDWIKEFEHSTMAKKGQTVHPTIQLLVSNLNQVKLALESVRDIDNIEAINFNGPRDLEFIGSDSGNEKWADGVFLPASMAVLEHLKSLPTLKEKDFYRLGLLLTRVSEVFNPELMQARTEASTCGQFVANN